MTLPSGTRLGPYEISSLLGEGGMGEVYRARDTRLGRSVALKVLPPDLAASPERRRRFEQEARAISALDHPHICVLHDVGHQDGIAFLVMEELEGETLAHRLRKGALPLQQVLGFGVEIAEALYRAHRQGIVHRDVKPSNIMVTRSGTKLLDFGVAKLRAAMDPALTSDPGAPAAGETTVTTDGGIVGTFQYMAPEQLEGNEPDARTDIFALGALLYEMATGRRAFAGENRATLIAAILRSDPVPISILQPLAPPGLDRVVATCLAKDPDDRWQNTRDLASALRLIGETGSQGRGTALVPAPRRDRVAWTIAAIASALLVALALVVAMSRERPAPPLRVHFQIPAPEKTTFSGWTMAVSPDGERIAFAASAEGGNHLYVKPLNAISATRVPGTEGGSWPFWSPDGRQLGFLAEGKLKRIDVSGGAAQVVADFRGSYFAGASWSREGGILYSASGELARVRAGLGKPQPLTGAEWESARFWPQFLPDGRRYLYFSQAVSPGRRGIYVASLDSGERTWILATDDNAEYSPSGHLLFVRGGALMAQAFDAQSLQLSGEAFPVREQVAVSRVWTPRAAFSVAANGVLAWRQGRGSNMQLTWFDRSGRKLGTVGDPAAYSNPTLSPDERRLAVDRVDEQRNTRDLWVFDLARGTRTRLTFDPGEDFVAAWSPDGRRIAFTSDRKGVRDIYQKLSDGSGDDELLLDSRDGPKHVEDWSADGTRLLFNYYRGGVADLFLLPLSSGADRKPIPLVATDSWEDQGQLAPDGRWIAHRSYRANEPPEVYVRGVSADGSSSRGKWQISSAGGREPRWRGDGKELFFLSGSTFMAVDVKTDGSAFEAGVPKPLFEVPQLPEVRRNRYVVTRDGQRFLVNMVLEETIEPIQVLVNWLPSNR